MRRRQRGTVHAWGMHGEMARLWHLSHDVKLQPGNFVFSTALEHA